MNAIMSANAARKLASDRQAYVKFAEEVNRRVLILAELCYHICGIHYSEIKGGHAAALEEELKEQGYAVHNNGAQELFIFTWYEDGEKQPQTAEEKEAFYKMAQKTIQVISDHDNNDLPF